MKKIAFLLPLLIIGCSTTTKTAVIENKAKGLYEILSQQSQDGASIKFFEILTEEDEIGMLRGDETLKGKISADDMKNSTIVILNMGEKPTGGFSISVQDVQELPDRILMIIKENEPAADSMVTMGITNPYTIVKINSKKKIEIR